MILVLANVYLKEGKEKEFITVAKKCIDESVKEKGNISYELKQNPYNSLEFTFVEKWQSKEILGEHMKTKHFGNLGEDIKDLLDKDLEITLYNAEEATL